MGNERFHAAKRIFLRAVELTGEARARMLDSACAADGELRREVESMLSLDARSARTESTRVDPPGQSPVGAATRDADGAPLRIGRYRVLSKLGEGGFGVVYLAEQEEPVRRRVALKIIKPGMDSARVIARFEAERQALALMDHPNIAKVLDAGTTPEDQGSRPYFVMEHVAGEPITDYCDRHNLRTGERLGLFVRVCEAVQHAHTKGVIHRDLKPSNVLVSVRQNEEPTPKVIDFGVAKALHQPLTDRDVFTEQGQMIGTPEYMSPEQAEMGALDIDTRADVYSLGVMLYELLAGARPFDLGRQSMVQMARTIREVDPPRPSTRLNSLGEGGSRVAKQRQTTVPTLASELASELEWIPLKAMRKDRTDRYQTVASLGGDVRNYLAGLPLEAGPESGLYRVRKFVGRHKGTVIGAATVAGAVLLGLVATALATLWALNERNLARSAAFGERAATTAALEAQARAERGEGNARDTTRFLTELLLAAGPAARGPDTTIAESLDHAARVLDRDDSVPIAEELERRLLLARAYETLHLDERALEQTRLIREGLDAGATLDDRSLGVLSLTEGGSLTDPTEAVAALDRSIEAFSRADAQQEWATALSQKARVLDRIGAREQAEAAILAAIQVERSRPGSADDLAMMVAIHATIVADLGRTDEARLLTEESLALGEKLAGDNPYLRGGLFSHAGRLMLGPLNDPARADVLFAGAIELLEPIFTEQHPQIARLHMLRGMGRERIDDFDGAHTEFAQWELIAGGRAEPRPDPEFVEGLMARSENHSHFGRGGLARQFAQAAVDVAGQLAEGDSSELQSLRARAQARLDETIRLDTEARPRRGEPRPNP